MMIILDYCFLLALIEVEPQIKFAGQSYQPEYSFMAILSFLLLLNSKQLIKPYSLLAKENLSNQH
jgi:hypothetical protein